VRIRVHVCVRFGYIILLLGVRRRRPAVWGGGVARARSARGTGSPIRCTDEKKINTVYMTVCVSMQRKYNQFANITIIIIFIIIIIIIFGQLFARARECVRVVSVQCARGRVCVSIYCLYPLIVIDSNRYVAVDNIISNFIKRS